MRHLLAASIIVCGGLFAGVVHAADEDEAEDPPAKTEKAAARPAPADDAADSGSDADAADERPAPRMNVHREGDYGGVTPEHAKNPEGHGRAARKGRAASSRLLVTWVGFQAKEGGAARIFVQLSADATYEQKMVGDALVVFVAGARLGQRNDGRFIDTTFFDTVIARVQGKNVSARHGSKAGVELTVHFKKGAAKLPDIKSETGADGHRYLFLDFAP
jgi:hypothetical protein